MPGVKIEVSLADDRTKSGLLQLRDADTGAVLLADVPVLGRADRATAALKNNGTGNRTKPYGDTPLGTYGVVRIHTTGAGTDYPAASYGPNGAIRLEPVGGEALTAKLNGRTGLLVHGGRDKGTGKLVPTNGCLRVSDADMTRIIDTIVAHSVKADQNRCEALKIVVGITDAAAELGIDDGDPPPSGNATPILP